LDVCVAGPDTTVWILGDQLDPSLPVLREATPATHRLLVIESESKVASRAWHRQRAHLIITAMRRFVTTMRDQGFDVDHRRAPTLAAGHADHVAQFAPVEVVATQAHSWAGQRLLDRLGVTSVTSDHFLCSRDAFAAWAGDRRSLRMEDFYRWQRRRLGYLMDGDEPAEGRWNFDAENREPPPSDGRTWPAPLRDPLDDLDREVLAGLPASCWGEDPDGTWATSREGALRRLDYAVREILPRFGPHEDAMLSGNWHLAHTLLSPYLNLGLLRPDEVCDAVDAAYREGRVPIASAEGFIRQVIGWREYVWGTYWLWMPDYAEANALGAHRPLPPVFTGAPTAMRCVDSAVGDVRRYGWTHHIQRLMVLGNLCLIAGVDPAAVTRWMWEGFVDGAEWVMLPNVVGMALHADGGRMASKPYAAGGAYIDRMSDYCKGCRYDRRKRTGPDACPFTTLYWDFMARHRERFLANARVARQVRASERLSDLDEVRVTAADMLDRLDAGEL
jgi:deoxyribodipyrimidine photolyase-related protein